MAANRTQIPMRNRTCRRPLSLERPIFTFSNRSSTPNSVSCALRAYLVNTREKGGIIYGRGFHFRGALKVSVRPLNIGERDALLSIFLKWFWKCIFSFLGWESRQDLWRREPLEGRRARLSHPRVWWHDQRLHLCRTPSQPGQVRSRSKGQHEWGEAHGGPGKRHRWWKRRRKGDKDLVTCYYIFTFVSTDLLRNSLSSLFNHGLKFSQVDSQWEQLPFCCHLLFLAHSGRMLTIRFSPS